MTNEELERAVERVDGFVQRWGARIGFGAQTGDLIYAVAVHGFDGDAELRADDLSALISERAELLAAVERMRGALELARHALVTIDNYRVTDLTVEQFDAHLNNGVPRDRLEFMTDYSAEVVAIDAALTTGEANHKDKP